MATPTIPDDDQTLPDEERHTSERLLALEQRLDRDGHEALRTARNFEIFALAALALALVTLLAVVVKLDGKDTIAHRVGPMMSRVGAPVASPSPFATPVRSRTSSSCCGRRSRRRTC